MTMLVTGAAGFIGMHLALRLARDGADVVGVDNFDPYYDVALKRARADQLARAGVRCIELDLADHAATEALFRDGRYTRVAHLAAQPGVRYSLQNPAAYIRNNIDAFAAVIEACRHTGVEHLAYASSSSVYGANHTLPYSEDQNVDHPMSLYAATKKADELIAHSYSHLYRLPTTGLRFFTVYGPWGRPDMAAALFTRAIVDGTPVKVFNFGRMRRDFTYIDDVVEGVVRVLSLVPGAADAGAAPYAIYNIGNHTPVSLPDYITTLERALGKKAKLKLMPMQAGDVKATYADTRALKKAVGFAPSTPLQAGLERFAAWFKQYYGYA